MFLIPLLVCSFATIQSINGAANTLKEKTNPSQAANTTAQTAQAAQTTGTAQAGQAAGADTAAPAAADQGAAASTGANASGFTDADFKTAVTALGKPDAAAKAPYFVKSLADSGITSRREAAMFLAQLWHESGKLEHKTEIKCKTALAECDAAYPIKKNGVSGQHYFGRGYIQLTHDGNYELASKALLGDGTILLKDPEMVSRDESMAWRTAAWYWKTRVHVLPEVLQGKFGATTKGINGALECGATKSTIPLTRLEYYRTIMTALKEPGPIDGSGC